MTYPSYAAVVSSAAPVNDTAFLLCKPDAEEAHRAILQVVSEVGFQVQAKNFRITASVALELAKMFPSVRRKRETTRTHAAGLHGGGGGGGRAPGESIADPGPTDNTRGVVGVVPPQTAATTTGTSSRPRTDPGVRDDRVRFGQVNGPRYEDMSADEWLDANVQHLLRSGTCLALTLCAPNAVERLAELAGPENPSVAQRVAPRSLRALFGTDLLRNAVHAATTLTEANAAIQLVFGYEPRYAVVESRTTAGTNPELTASTAAATVTTFGVPDERSAGVGVGSGGGGVGGDEGHGTSYSGARPSRPILRLPHAGSVSLGAGLSTGDSAAGPTLGYRRGLPEPVTLSALLSPTRAAATSSPERATGVRGGGGGPVLAFLTPTSEAAGGGGGGGRGPSAAPSVSGSLPPATFAAVAAMAPVATDAASASTPAGGLGSSRAGSVARRSPQPQPQPPHALHSPDTLAMYEKVVHQQQLLRVREMDLLLREQAFQERIGGSGGDRRPPPHTHGSEWGRVGSARVQDGIQVKDPHARLRRGSSGVRHGALSPHSDDAAAYEPRVRARTREGDAIQLASLSSVTRTGGGNTAARQSHFWLSPTDASTPGKLVESGAGKSVSALVIVDHGDLLPLIHLAERRQALFNALDTHKLGVITQADFLRLYARSPAIQLCQPSDEDVVRQLVLRVCGSAETSLDYNSFSVALLHLLKQ